MGFIETSYGSSPNLSQVNIDSNLNLGTYGITTDGELNINDSDLIGVKQFVCKDYLGTVKATASDNLQATITLDNVTGTGNYSKKFRVPSNFVNNASVKISFYATNPNTGFTLTAKLYKYNEGSYTEVGSVSIPQNTTTPTEYTTTLNNINAGEVYCFMGSNNVNVLGASGIKIKCDLALIAGALWEVSD